MRGADLSGNDPDRRPQITGHRSQIYYQSGRLPHLSVYVHCLAAVRTVVGVAALFIVMLNLLFLYVGNQAALSL